MVVAVRVLRMWDLFQLRRQVLFAEGRHRGSQQAGIAIYFLLRRARRLGAFAAGAAARVLLVLLAPVPVVFVAAVAGYGVSRLRHARRGPAGGARRGGRRGAWERRRA